MQTSVKNSHCAFVWRVSELDLIWVKKIIIYAKLTIEKCLFYQGKKVYEMVE